MVLPVVFSVVLWGGWQADPPAMIGPAETDMMPATVRCRMTSWF
jgi:hypothetical protein